MSQTITVSNELYERLLAEAAHRGLDSMDEVLEALLADKLRKRQEVVDRITALSERIAANHGIQSDSVDLIREDRDR